MPKSALDITPKHTDFIALEATYKTDGEAFLTKLYQDASKLVSDFPNSELVEKNVQQLEKAIELFVFAAQKKHGLALNSLLVTANTYYEGSLHCPKDLVKAAQLYKIAAELGNQFALQRLNIIAAELNESNSQLSFECFRCAAELGNLDSKYNLGICYVKGIGVKQNVDVAVDILKACHATGNKKSLNDIITIAGKFFQDKDKKIKQDLKKSAELFIFAAQQGDIQSLNNVTAFGKHYYFGEAPFPKDIAKAVELCIIAANLGDKTALNNLAAFGHKLVESHPTLAFQCLRSANQLDYLEAKCNLGACYVNGVGVPRDLDMGIKLFKECLTTADKITLKNIDQMDSGAATKAFKEWFVSGNKDNTDVQNALANLNTLATKLFYGDDEKIKKDLKKATELFIFAAQNGLPEALNNLVVIADAYFNGTKPCSKDIREAIKLWKLASELGNKDAINNLKTVAVQLKETDPKLSFECMNSAATVGDSTAKRNIGVYYLDGIGVSPDISETIKLFKECYAAGDNTALNYIHTVGVNFLSGQHENIKKDIKQAIQLIIFAADNGSVSAQENLCRIAQFSLAPEQQNNTSGVPENIRLGVALLKHLSCDKFDKVVSKAAKSQLDLIRAFNIPLPLPSVPDGKKVVITLGDFRAAYPTKEEPHSPLTAEYLTKNRITFTSGQVHLTGGFNSSVATDGVKLFKEQRSLQKCQRYTAIRDGLSQNFTPDHNIREIIFEYYEEDKALPTFLFQYDRALREIDHSTFKLETVLKASP